MTVVRPLRSLVFAVALAVVGCHAQTPEQGAGKLSPELARRVEVLLRSRTKVPPNYDIHIGPRTKSEVAGYDQIVVTFTAAGQASKPLTFLLSSDGKTLAQFSKFDLSKDPKELVSAANRPARGGPANAPVVIVGFDDLECPYCAKMHAQLFPALTERYKNQVHIVYRDFPLDQHPWAMRAAIDANCLAAQSHTGYWNMVDNVHSHAADLGGDAKSLDKAKEALDTMAREEGTRQKVDAAALNACIAKQDDTAVKASIKEAEALGVDSTPALFINGEKLEGALPLEYVYRMIDNALIAAGQTPPPQAPQTPPAVKPGS
jgi:protein-disulfide isomerase